LRRHWSGDQRLFARRCLVSIAIGFIGASWAVDGAPPGLPETISDSNRHYKLSDHLVDHRLGSIRGDNLTDHKAKDLSFRLATFHCRR